MARRPLAERVAELVTDGGEAVPGDLRVGHESLLRRLLADGRVEAGQLQQFLSCETGHPSVNSLPEQALTGSEELTDGFLDEREALRLTEDDTRFGMVWPQDTRSIDELSHRLGQRPEIACMSHADLAGLRREQHQDDGRTIVESLFGNELEPEEIQVIQSYDLADDGEDADDAPIIKLLNHVIVQAYHDQASDIHVEPEEKVSRVRFRVDGELREALRIPKRMHNAIVSRIKIMSDLDIAEKRSPQDGRIQLRLSEAKLDVRVSTIPSVFGEKVVLRVLNPGAVYDLGEIGLSPEQEQGYRGIVTRPYGIILVTGPTGSGKTTTLYSTLRYLNSRAKNIITIEDPVEYQMENISQIQVNRKAGIDFASGLKSILRQDPDIIMVGEMRDEETASIAVKAALTGHLVLSTLHTNDAPGSYARLCDMHIAPYLLASSISGILAQRLVRVICPGCRAPEEPDPQELHLIGMEPDSEQAFFHGVGCRECDGTGYRGRTAIYELLTPTPEVKKRVLAGKLQEGTDVPGFAPMIMHGRQKVLEGITSVSEVCKIVRAQLAY